jgi:GTP-binding protein
LDKIGTKQMAATATQQVREWTGLQQFPVATQTALINILGKLRQQNVDSLTVVVMGKGGVGKSSTVNSLVGERVAVVSAFQSETTRPLQCSRARAGFTLNIIDTPGLVEGGCVNDQAVDIIRRFLLNKTIDVMLYVDRLDGYRVDNLDKQVMRAITRCFGSQIWRIGIVVLTHAQLSPADGVEYLEFVSKRSAALQEAIRQSASLKKSDKEVPICLVENSGRCNVNSGGEKILPNETVWLISLVERIVELATSENKSILVDKKLIDGPDANRRGKLWIPLVLLAQFLLIVWPIRKAIQRDLEEEKQHRPQWEIRAEEFRRSSGILEDDRADEQAITEALQQDDIALDQLNDFDDDDDDIYD